MYFLTLASREWMTGHFGRMGWEQGAKQRLNLMSTFNELNDIAN